jgi:cytoskeleton protein RodZ
MEQIGARLREARMGAKIDINQVESDTKIRAKYLRAMENEEWSLLPGEIYAKTFLRTYADYLGIDSRELLDDYRRQYERPTDHDLRPLTSGRERDRRQGAGRRQRGGRYQPPQPRGGGGLPIPPWALVLIVLVVVGVALWIVGNDTGNHGSTTTSTSTTVSKHHKHNARKHGAAAKHHPAAPKSVRLSLVPTGAVYVCLVNGHGRKLINGQQYSAGQKIPMQVGHTLLLTLGTSSVTITANGVKIPVAPSSTPIGIRFTPGKHASIASGSQPQCS